VANCDFADIKRSAIHGMKECIVHVENSRFSNCTGNGVNFEFASGFVKDSWFSKFGYPAIAVFGPAATPVITNCVIEDAKGMGIVTRDACAPVFKSVHLNRIGLNGFSISDVSRPIIIGCRLRNIEKEPLAIFNGARPRLIGNYITSPDKPAFCVLTRGVPDFQENVFIGTDFFRLDRFGALPSSRFRNNLILRDRVHYRIGIQNTRFSFFACP
jgi:hypothetical protein